MTYRVSGNGWFASAWRNNPVTLAMVLAMAWIFLLGFGGAHLAAWLVFDTGNPVNLTLGAFTYPLVTNDIIALLLGGYMLWIFGSSLERGWGTRFYVLYLLVVNLITLVVWEGGLLLF